MKKSRLFLYGMTALALAAPAWAADGPVAKAASELPDDMEVVPSVNPGDQIGIACNVLAKSDADSDVRVVLTISAEPGELPPGYKKILATDAQVGNGAVRVRIPTVPDIEDHTVNVDVYVVGDKGAQSCDAGHMKIVRRPMKSPSGTVG